MSKQLFEAAKAVRKHFEQNTKGESAAVKWYYYYDGQVLESMGKPVHNTPGYKFQCSWREGDVNVVSID